MIKRFANSAFIYAIVAMIFGVFYREFTRFSGFTQKTNLSVIHTHYFLLGMIFFLIMMLLEKNFAFSNQKKVKVYLILYHIGLNITGIGFLIRGLVQVWESELSKGIDASISGVSGIGHILIGIGIIALLLQIRKQVA